MSATATRTQTLNFRDAIRQALIEELERDPRVLLFGEDVARAGGVFKVTEGIADRVGTDRVGADRVLDTPISELAIAGAGFGAAVTGSRPVIEIMFGDFMALAMDSLINQSAKWPHPLPDPGDLDAGGAGPQARLPVQP